MFLPAVSRLKQKSDSKTASLKVATIITIIATIINENSNTVVVFRY